VFFLWRIVGLFSGLKWRRLQIATIIAPEEMNKKQ